VESDSTGKRRRPCGLFELEALSGTTTAFDARIHALRPHPRQKQCAENLRNILEGSDFTALFRSGKLSGRLYSALYAAGSRGVRDAVAYAEWLLTLELNSVTDIRDFLRRKCENIEVISGGIFTASRSRWRFDYLAIALAELGNISERRLMRLTDEASNAHVSARVFDRNRRFEFRFYDRAIHSSRIVHGK
jgi:histidine ammonia-lyase